MGGARSAPPSTSPSLTTRCAGWSESTGFSLSQNAKINLGGPDGAQPPDETTSTYPRLPRRPYTASSHRRADGAEGDIRHRLRVKRGYRCAPSALRSAAKQESCVYESLRRPQTISASAKGPSSRSARATPSSGRAARLDGRRGGPNRAVQPPSQQGELFNSSRKARKRAGLENSDFFRTARFVAAVSSAPQSGRRRTRFARCV